jgi:uncharacterized membrane protein YfcA
MDLSNQLVVAFLIACVSLLYATVGQAGGTAFLAIMAVAEFPSFEMRTTALFLNVVAAGYATWRLHRKRLVDWNLLAHVTVPSLVTAFAGGLIVITGHYYFILTGTLLVVAAGMMVFRRTADKIEQHKAGPVSAVVVGGAAGFVAGLTGVGGGVFLTPLPIALGWASPRNAAAISPGFILANSVTGLAGVLLAGQSLVPAVPLYAASALLGAILGTAIGPRWMSQQATRYLLAAILLFAGVRLLFR